MNASARVRVRFKVTVIFFFFFLKKKANRKKKVRKFSLKLIKVSKENKKISLRTLVWRK